MEEIANTMDAPKRTGEGKSMGYEVPSCSSTTTLLVDTSRSVSGAAGSSSTAVIGSFFFTTAPFCEGNGGNPTSSSLPSDAFNTVLLLTTIDNEILGTNIVL